MIRFPFTLPHFQAFKNNSALKVPSKLIELELANESWITLSLKNTNKKSNAKVGGGEGVYQPKAKCFKAFFNNSECKLICVSCI